MSMNAKQARKAWEAARQVKAQAPSVPQPRKPRKLRMTAEERRERALEHYAQLVYDTDRDYEVEFS